MMSLTVETAPVSLQQAFGLLHRARRVLSGNSPGAQTPTPSVLRINDVGLLYFLNEKQTALHRAIGAVHVSGTSAESTNALEPVRLLVEFMSFAVSGLIVEAERIDEAALLVQQEINDVSTELRKLDLELQFRRQRTGSNVTRVLSQHYKTRVSVPTVHASDQLDSQSAAELREFSTGIITLRATLGDLKKRKAAIVHAQRLLHGCGASIPAVEAEAIVNDLPMLLTFRKAHHTIRDALVLLRKGEEDTSPALTSLVEFLLHIEIGLSAATDDVDAAVIQMKKEATLREKDRADQRLQLLDHRNKQLSASAVKYNDALKRGVLQSHSAVLAGSTPTPRLSYAAGIPVTSHTATSETDAFLDLYCS